jgi:hypothetical protein
VLFLLGAVCQRVSHTLGKGGLLQFNLALIFIIISFYLIFILLFSCGPACGALRAEQEQEPYFTARRGASPCKQSSGNARSWRGGGVRRGSRSRGKRGSLTKGGRFL